MLSNPILALDISGSYHEGKGVTGWCLMRDGKVMRYGLIRAENYTSDMLYYKAHATLVHNMRACYKDIHVVLEDYLLYGSKAKAQINSRMETSQLLGILKYYCYSEKISCYIQAASLVKKRWSDDILIHKGIELPESREMRHARDAIRHATHHTYFGERRETNA